MLTVEGREVEAENLKLVEFLLELLIFKKYMNHAELKHKRHIANHFVHRTVYIHYLKLA